MQRVVFLVLLSSSACSPVTVEADVSSALSAATSASVFGLYRDGRMDSFYWEQLAQTVSKQLGAESCELGVSPALREQLPKLFDQIATESRENGPSAEVLGLLADRANADLLLLFYSVGRPPRQKAPAKVEERHRDSVANGSHPMRKPGGGRNDGPAVFDDDKETTNILELTMKVYSRVEKKFVGFVKTRIEGTEMKPSVEIFTAQIGERFPSLRCVGWALTPASLPARE